MNSFNEGNSIHLSPGHSLWKPFALLHGTSIERPTPFRQHDFASNARVSEPTKTPMPRDSESPSSGCVVVNERGAWLGPDDCDGSESLLKLRWNLDGFPDWTAGVDLYLQQASQMYDKFFKNDDGQVRFHALMVSGLHNANQVCMN